MNAGSYNGVSSARASPHVDQHDRPPSYDCRGTTPDPRQHLPSLLREAAALIESGSVLAHEREYHPVLYKALDCLHAFTSQAASGKLRKPGESSPPRFRNRNSAASAAPFASSHRRGTDLRISPKSSASSGSVNGISPASSHDPSADEMQPPPRRFSPNRDRSSSDSGRRPESAFSHTPEREPFQYPKDQSNNHTKHASYRKDPKPDFRRQSSGSSGGSNTKPPSLTKAFGKAFKAAVREVGGVVVGDKHGKHHDKFDGEDWREKERLRSKVDYSKSGSEDWREKERRKNKADVQFVASFEGTSNTPEPIPTPSGVPASASASLAQSPSSVASASEGQNLPDNGASSHPAPSPMEPRSTRPLTPTRSASTAQTPASDQRTMASNQAEKKMQEGNAENINQSSSAAAPSPTPPSPSRPPPPKEPPRMSIKELRAIAHGAGYNTRGMERSDLEKIAAASLPNNPPPPKVSPDYQQTPSVPASTASSSQRVPPNSQQSAHSTPAPATPLRTTAAKTSNTSDPQAQETPVSNPHSTDDIGLFPDLLGEDAGNGGDASLRLSKSFDNVPPRKGVKELKESCEAAGHDVSGMERSELERLAASLPLPSDKSVISEHGQEVPFSDFVDQQMRDGQVQARKEAAEAAETGARAHRERSRAQKRREEAMRKAQQQQQEEAAIRSQQEEAARRAQQQAAQQQADSALRAKQQEDAARRAQQYQQETARRAQQHQEEAARRAQQHQQEAARRAQQQQQDAANRAHQQQQEAARRAHQQQQGTPRNSSPIFPDIPVGGHQPSAQRQQQRHQQQKSHQQHQQQQAQHKQQQQQQPQQQHQPSKYSQMASDKNEEDKVSEIKRNILVFWALQQPAMQVLRPIEQLVCSFHTILPPAFGATPNDYYKKWKAVNPPDITSGMGLDDNKLKKAVRKVKFFLHPDKLPRDLPEEQIFLCKMLWDIIADAWTEFCTKKEHLDWTGF